MLQEFSIKMQVPLGEEKPVTNNLRLHVALSYGQDLILHKNDLKVDSLLLFFKYTQILTF